MLNDCLAVQAPPTAKPSLAPSDEGAVTANAVTGGEKMFDKLRISGGTDLFSPSVSPYGEPPPSSEGGLGAPAPEV